MPSFDMYMLAVAIGVPNWNDPGTGYLKADLAPWPNSLVECGFLTEVEPAKYARCPCGLGHCGQVYCEEFADKTLYLLPCEEGNGLFFVTPEELRQWRVDLHAVLTEIQHQLKCIGEPEAETTGYWDLGTSRIPIAGVRRRVFFAERITPEIESAMQDGLAAILIIAQPRHPDVEKFKDRQFQLHDLLSLDENGTPILDIDMIAGNCGLVKASRAKKPSKSSKNAEQKSREEIIKRILIDEAISLHDAMKDAEERGTNFDPPRRISCQRIAELIRIMSDGKKTPNQSTVNKTIKNSTDKELKIIWEGLQDRNFIAQYTRNSLYGTYKK